MADHSKPTTTSTYVNFVSELDGRLDDISLGLDPATTSPTNLATNAIRWTSASNKWQKYNGTTWADLSSAYSININGTVGATTPASGAFTTLSATGNVTLGDASGDTVTINGTVDAGVVISGSTATDALRITQTGAGNALVVEDSTNPDNTPFVVDASGNVGIGTSSPGTKLDVYGTIQTTNGSIYNSTPANQEIGFRPGTTVGRLGEIVFTPTNSASALTTLIKIRMGTTDLTSGSERAYYQLRMKNANGNDQLYHVVDTSSDIQYFSTNSSERMRIDSSGNVAIGSTGTNSAVGLNITKTITGGTNAYAQLNSGIVQSGVTGTAAGFYSRISLAASTTTSTVTHFIASAPAGGAGSTITNHYGYLAESTLGTAGAATISSAVGFYGNLASGTDRYNFYAPGTANNYMAGNLGIGATPTTFKLTVVGNPIQLSGGTTSQEGIRIQRASGYASITGINNDNNAFNAIAFFTGASEAMRIDTSGNLYVESGTLWQYAPAHTAKSAAATLTAAELQTGIIVGTGTSYTLTMPTGTNIDAAFTGVPTTSIGFDFYVVSGASGTITMAVNTGVTNSGGLTIAAGNSAHFRLRRTAANTYVMYRLS